MPECHLREWRQRNGLTLDEVSALCGYSASLLSRVERNQRNLSPMARVTLARALNVPLRELFDAQPVSHDTGTWAVA